MLVRLCLCASENSIRQISGLILLLMLMLMSRVFSLVMLMLSLCLFLCASENRPLQFGHPTQANIGWITSICCYSNLLANEMPGMSAISTVLFLWWLHFGCSGQRPYPQNGYFCTLHVFADNTQLKSLKKFNLQPLATTYCPFDYSFRQKARARKLNNITSTKI